MAKGVEEYLAVAHKWQTVAAANERFMNMMLGLREGGAALTAAAGFGGVAGSSGSSGQMVPAANGGNGVRGGGTGNGAADVNAAHFKLAQLLLAVGFELGMWDLLSVLQTASQACQAVQDLVCPPEAAAAGAIGGGGVAGPSAAALMGAMVQPIG
jgi:hypothetical protein